MAQKIDWKELFDLTKDAEIKAAIKLIQKLNKEYITLASNLKKQNKHISNAVKDVSGETKKLTDSTAKLNKEQRSQTSQLAKQAKATDEVFKKAKKLAEAKRNLTVFERKYGQSVDTLNAKLKVQALGFLKLDSATKKGRLAISKLGGEMRKTSEKIREITGVTKNLNNAFNRTENSYNGLTKANGRLLAQLRALPNGFSKTNKKAAELKNQIAANTAKLKEFDRAVGQNFRSVGNYRNALTGARSSLKSFALQLAVTTLGLMALFTAAKEGFNSFVDFEFILTSVKALSGATEEEFARLTEQAKRLGAETANTAGDIAQLQLELTKLGFKPDQIIKSTEAINQLSIAFKSDLGETAKVVASTIKAFNLEAEESAKIADVYAKAFATSALNLEKLIIAMPKVASASEAVNISVETTTAILGKFMDQGIEASIAGTGFRNVLLELAKPTSKLSKLLGGTVQSEEDLFRAMDQLAESGIDVTDSMIEAGEATGALGIVAELTGTRTAIALLSMVKNREEIQKQSKVLVEATGFLAEYSEIMEGTVSIGLKKVISAAEGFAIALFEGLRPAIMFIISALIKFFTVLKAGVEVIRDNKELFKALAIALIGFKVQAIFSAAANLKLAVSLQLVAIRAKYTRFHMLRLYATMLANPLGLFVAALAALYLVFNNIHKLSARHRKEQKLFNEVYKESAEAVERLNTGKKILKGLQEDINKLSKEDIKFKLLQIKTTRNQALADLVALKAKRLVAIEAAKELSISEKVTIASISGAFAYKAIGEQSALTKEVVKKNTKKIADVFDEMIQKQIDSLSGYDKESEELNNSIVKSEQEKADELAALTDKQIADARALHIFRLEMAAKTIEAEMDASDTANQGFEALAIALKNKLIEIEEIKRDALLEQENLTASGRTLILEQFAAKATDISNKVSDTVTSKMIADLERLQKTFSGLDIADIDQPEDEDLGQESEKDKLFKKQQSRQIKAFKDLEALRSSNEISEKEYLKRLDKLRDDYELNIIEGLKDVYGSSTEIWDLETAYFKRKNDEKEADAKETWSNISKFAQEAFNIGVELAQQVVAREVSDSEFRLERLEAERARDVELAGNNEAQKKIINEKAEADRLQLEARRRAALVKQANLEKVIAVTSAIINTAKAVTALLATPPLAIAAGVIGAAQVATIVAQPLPQFYMGTDSAPEGYAEVGERGRELMVTPDGSLEYAMTPQVKYLEKGTKVIEHSKTKQIEDVLFGSNPINDRALKSISNDQKDPSKEMAKVFSKGNKEMIRAVKGMERFSFVGTSRGIRAFAENSRGRTELLNERYG